MDKEIDEDPVNWQEFHNTTREYVIFLLLFVFLYVGSYFFIRLFRKKMKTYPDCYEDAFVYRITLWLSSFSLSISIGAALLLPISIISNEVLLLYPNSYYVQWLNSSLIQGLWNLVFLFSNLSLFLFLPFSHFILESEGFPGSSKGIMARVNEAALVLALTAFVIMGIIYMISAILNSGPYIHTAFTKSWKTNIYGLSSYYLPFLYSCVSFVGVLMLLLCTPLGFARLFTVMNNLLIKRKISAEEIEPIENPVQETKLHHVQNVRGISKAYHIGSFGQSKENIYSAGDASNIHHRGLFEPRKEDVSASGDASNIHHRGLFEPRKEDVSAAGEASNIHHRVSFDQSKEHVYAPVDASNVNIPAISDSPRARLRYMGDGFLGQSQFLHASHLRAKCLYPTVMIVLVILTMLCVLTVSQNTLELCFGIKPLPVVSQNLALGITSLSALGPIGAALEILMILYLYCTSIIGLYSLPLFRRLRPTFRSTSLNQIVGNCAVLLVLSSALPVLARSLGITNFDLLGDFGRINWLGNFYIVLVHNIVFAGSVAICLGKKIQSSLYPISFLRNCKF